MVATVIFIAHFSLLRRLSRLRFLGYTTFSLPNIVVFRHKLGKDRVFLSSAAQNV